MLAKVPENVPWVRCARCGIVEIEGKWENTTEAEVWDELLHRNLVVHERAEDIQLAMEPVKVSDRHTLLHIQLEGVIDDLLFQEEHTMRARMANGVCLTCTRRAGNYFEATVQLRSTARRLTEEEFKRLRATLEDVLDKLSDDPMFFITTEGPVTGGYDVVLGSKGLARAWGRHLISEYGGMVVETNSTVGRKDGVDVTRLTLLYRKPGYEIGDVIIRSKETIVLDPYNVNTKTGRFVLVDQYETVGGGIISMEGYPNQRGRHNVVSTNIEAVASTINQKTRASVNGHTGGIIWLTGLSGAGKTKFM